MSSDETSRWVRWIGIARLAVRRTIARAARTSGRQTLLSIGGVATAVALLLLVTSVGLGFTAGGILSGTEADYWVVPEGGAGSAVTTVESQKLGQVHAAASRMRAIEGVTAATPVLSSLLRVPGQSDSEYVLIVGVVPNNETQIMGMSTKPLTRGDPYFANGSYQGVRTGEAVLSGGAAELLGLSNGERFELQGGSEEANATFRVTGTDGSSAVGQFPVVVVHLSELQVVAGAAEGDIAEQILVTASPEAKDEIAAVYPESDVLSRTGLLQQQARSSETTVAVAAAALVVALVVGVLTVMTTLGFEIRSDARNHAVMAAVGFSRRSRLALIGSQTIAVALVGGLLGIGAGGLGVFALNTASRAYYSVSVAFFHPSLLVYGLAVALLIGVLAVPYLLIIGGRMNVLGRLEVR